MIKLFVSDIDGTFLNEHHAVSEYTKQSVKELVDSGVKVILASGRNYAGMQMINKEVGLDLECIALNGAQYCDTKGNNVLLHELDKNCLDIVQPIFEKHHTATEIYTDKGNYINLDLINIREVYKKNLYRMEGMNEINAQSFLDAIDFESFMVKELDINKIRTDKVLKMELHYDNEKDKEDKMKELNTISNVQISTSLSTNVEITNEHATKGDMIAHVCELYNIHHDEVVVIGDSMNDISMLTKYKHSIAMGNASKEIQQHASYVAKSNDQDGCAKVMQAIIEHNKR